MFTLRLRSLVREEVSGSRRDLMALSNSQLALTARVPLRDRQVTAQGEAMVSDFTVAMPRKGCRGASAKCALERAISRWRTAMIAGGVPAGTRIPRIVSPSWLANRLPPMSGDQATPRVPYHAPLPLRRIGRRQPVRFECALTRRSYVVGYSRDSCAALSGANHHSLLQFIERA
jgi:hypothetical protein